MPDPVAGPGEVLLDVAYAGCNWADTQVRTGLYPHPMTYPMVLGFEVSGTVAALGPGAIGVEVGDRVAAFPEKGGAYAERCVASAAGLIKLPAGIGLGRRRGLPDPGGSRPITCCSPIYRSRRRATLCWSMPIGAASASCCTQLAVQAGARVIGATGTPGKEKRALEYGASKVVVTSREDFVKAALDFSNGKGVDLAIDSYGATMLDRTFDAVRTLGHIINIGEAEGQPFKNIRERILPRSQTFTRLHLGHVDQASPEWKAGVDHVLGGIAAGWLKIPIEGVFPLAEAAEMHRRLEGRHVAGKLLLKASAG